MDLHADVAMAALDAFEDTAAVLDADGVIVATNRAWESFGTQEGRDFPFDDAGRNYLDTSRDGGEHAQRVHDALTRLLDGDGDDTVRLEYPCHSPTRRRWFLMRADRFAVDGETYVLVTHTNITERVAAEITATQRYDRMLDVASYVSHDLRNPLTIARGWLETVMDGGDPAELERVESALKRMDDMISGAVELLRVERDGIDRESVDLEATARSAWQFNVTSPDATLHVADSTTLDASPALLERVLANLFRNAVAHGTTCSRSQTRENAVDHSGDDVAVTVGTTNDGFFVEDDGPGIPPENREKVFDVGFTTAQGSTGLGLAFVREAVQLHGWTVSVAESGSGGARFEVHTSPETPAGESHETPA